MMENITVNLSKRVREVVENNVKYLVAPATILVGGAVLSGSKGALLYPPDECKASPGAWNGMPLVLNHPTDGRGNNISAHDEDGKLRPYVVQNHLLGEVRKDKWDGETRNVEAWFDAEKTKAKSTYIYDCLVNHRPIELSTGLFTDNDEQQGTNKDGIAYNAVARNYRPDHLAILPNQVGACSINDGCGVLNAEKEPTGNALTRLVHRIAEKLGITDNAWSEEARQAAVEARQKMKSGKEQHDAAKDSLASGKAAHEAGKEELRGLHEKEKDAAEESLSSHDEHTNDAKDHLNEIASNDRAPDEAHADFGKQHEAFDEAITDHYVHSQNKSPKELVASAKSIHEGAKSLLKAHEALKPDDKDDRNLSAEELHANGEHLKGVVESTKKALDSAKEHLDHRRGMREIRKLATNAASLGSGNHGIAKLSAHADELSTKADELSDAANDRDSHEAARDAHHDAAEAHRDAATEAADPSATGAEPDYVVSGMHANAASAHEVKAANHEDNIEMVTGNSNTNITTNFGEDPMYDDNDPAGCSKNAAMASMTNKDAREPAMKAMDAAQDGDSGKAAKAHIAAAKIHEDLATKARKDDRPAQANQNDQAAAMHRKAASLHMATTDNAQGEPMDRAATIKHLTTNCKCWKGKEKVLNTFSDPELAEFKRQNEIVVNAKLDSSGVSVAKTGPSKDPNDKVRKTGKGDVADDSASEDDPTDNDDDSDGGDDMVDNAKPLAEILKNRPKDLAVWNTVVEAANEHKRKLVDQVVTANAGTAEAQKLIRPTFERMTVKELKTIIASMPTANQRINLTGDQDTDDTVLDFSGAVAGFGAPVANYGAVDANAILDYGSYDYDEAK